MEDALVAAPERPAVAITMGDPAGVGPELCLRALDDAALGSEVVPVVFGDNSVLLRVAAACGCAPPARVVSEAQWAREPHADTATVVDCAVLDERTIIPGVISERCGRAAYRYIEVAIGAALRGEVAAVATAPLHKEALQLAQVPFPGHTEIFAALTKARRACMLLVSDVISTSFVTTHVGLVDMAQHITTARVLDVIELTAEAIYRLRGRASQIAVCGLNPHAGEHGLFGRGEEERIIVPAIAAAREQGLHVEGPLSPDAAFLPTKRRQIDAYVCMYHDQGHIPFKMLAFDSGVNVTLGLPIVRTSVDHGTAFDIAWSGQASAASLFQAVRLAARLARGTRQAPSTPLEQPAKNHPVM